MLHFFKKNTCRYHYQNLDDIIYNSWDREQNIAEIGNFRSFFCPFSPLTTWKIKILKLKKTTGDIIILHICTINDNHIWCMVPEIWRVCVRQNFWSFWTVFYPFTPYGLRKSKFWKNEKTTWTYYHSTQVYHKWQSYDVWFLK